MRLFEAFLKFRLFHQSFAYIFVRNETRIAFLPTNFHLKLNFPCQIDEIRVFSDNMNQAKLFSRAAMEELSEKQKIREF